jgi:hypothetical protein
LARAGGPRSERRPALGQRAGRRRLGAWASGPRRAASNGSGAGEPEAGGVQVGADGARSAERLRRARVGGWRQRCWVERAGSGWSRVRGSRLCR